MKKTVVRPSLALGLTPCIQALRPRQWTKNFIVFAAPLFALDISWQGLFGGCLALGLFCAISSSFYLINDIVDVSEDRQHPVKCKRPIAAGLVSMPMAMTMAMILLGGALVMSWGQSPWLGMTILSYAILQVAYNLKLKRIPILDVLAIAAGFVLRAIAGGVATGLFLSPWFIVCTAMLALFLGIEKRKAELRLSQYRGGKTRSVLKQYSLNLLTRMESTVTTCAVMSYSLWSAGPAFKGAPTPWMLLTIPFVLYGIFRYQLLSNPKECLEEQPDGNGQSSEIKTEQPEEVLLQDLPILLTVLGWIATSFVILLLQDQGVIH